MFSKKKSAGTNPDAMDTVIGEGSVFEGKIRSQAGVRIEGTINGDVESAGDVIIGEKGIVKSNIHARNVIIAGSVHGNVTAKDSLTILSSGQLNGNSSASRLVVNEGAVFNGGSRMEGKASSDGKESPSAPSLQPEKAPPSMMGTAFGDSMAM
ncbi:MAG: cell shape determination protein CcmA [Paenibacillaceae bacterium]|jgi:cytoskeletal protein CcmA (bactofilin family)|nr:cell shape determination protein CcmA [Paenibacillaceae bacterium]